MRKFVIILTIILLSLVACKKEDFLWNLPRVDCNFVYSAWSSCNSDNMQTRTYTSSSSGCTPPADSTQRSCISVILSSVVIGTQTWTTKNLDVTTYRNGDVIPQVQDASTWANLKTGAWCYYNNLTANGSSYGKLYNWYAVNDPRGLAPNGYLIPSDAEWTILTDYLGGEAVVGTKMKSTSGWIANGNGNNSSGFAGFPGGFRFDDGFFLGIGVYGYWWSSSGNAANFLGKAWCRILQNSSDLVSRYDFNPQSGFSVRCLREETSTCNFVYSSWSTCSNNIQTRTYASSPSGCTGTPPADSIQRPCVIVPPTCTFVYSLWSACSNNVQARTYASSPSGCTGTPPADSIQRPCVILPSIQIGNQTWTSINLDVTTYRNGDAIPQVQDADTWFNLSTGAWCYYENNTPNGNTYGKLYNWYAIKDPRGLAPNGYHIPTDAEWTILTTYLGGESVAGTKMKSTTGWQNNGNGTNTSGFSGLPGGYRYNNGLFSLIGSFGNWWSSSESSTNFAWCRYLQSSNGSLYRNNSFKQNGISVRCLKD